MGYIDEFRKRVFAFIAKQNMTDSGFGRAALGDPNFVRDLRRGRSPGERTVLKVDKFMAPPKPQKKRPSVAQLFEGD